jgi:HD-GYP domain-containing protein (c-di-GMP phosphodiesterase class II)
MSLQARMMGIADIFEALTASDRPYKPGMKLSQAMGIMAKFKLNGHIDPDLFEVFVRQGVYRATPSSSSIPPRRARTSRRSLTCAT